jgi:hypothetical protein
MRKKGLKLKEENGKVYSVMSAQVCKNIILPIFWIPWDNGMSIE